MNINEYKKYLSDIHGSVERVQKINERKVDAITPDAITPEENQSEVLDALFTTDVGTALLEFTCDVMEKDDISIDDVYEAFECLSYSVDLIDDFMVNNNEDNLEEIYEYLESYFGGELTEDTSTDDIINAFHDVKDLHEAFGETVKKLAEAVKKGASAVGKALTRQTGY